MPVTMQLRKENLGAVENSTGEGEKRGKKKTKNKKHYTGSEPRSSSYHAN